MHTTFFHNELQMNLIVCRHADKQSANQDSLLSSLGKWQSVTLGKAIYNEGIVNPYILSSPYGRCLQTATCVADEVGASDIYVEYGLLEGPFHIPGSMGSLERMQHSFLLIDKRYPTQLDEPSGEKTQHDVLPRCARMSHHIVDFFQYKCPHRDVVLITHGTVAISLVAAIAQDKSHSQHYNIHRIQGCCPAGYYKLVTSHSAKWKTEFACFSNHLPVAIGNYGTSTTPVCYFESKTQ